jgi:hypothetical protein
MAQDLGLRACAVAQPMTGLVVVWALVPGGALGET